MGHCACVHGGSRFSYTALVSQIRTRGCALYSQYTEYSIARKRDRVHALPRKIFKITHSEMESEGTFKNIIIIAIAHT